MAILIIDDESSLRRSLGAYLEDANYEILEAENGLKGLEVLREHLDEVEAVIVDLNMPVMDGYAFLKKAMAEAPDTPLVVLSGVGIVEDAIRAMRLGAWDYIPKPVHQMEIVEHILGKVMERARLIRENRIYQNHLEELVQQRTEELEQTRRQIMQRLSRAAEYKDNETGRHVIRVGEMSALLGKAMGLQEKRCELLRDCAPLHDIGKIGIPDHVLLKPGALDPEEWRIMQQHCRFGCEILGPLASKEEASRTCSNPADIDATAENEYLRLARILAMCHHEKWDGSGYPHGLRGEEIPIEARIVAAADAFDALMSDRPYKQALSLDESIEILRQGAGTHFDQRVIDAFERNLESIKAINELWGD